MGRLRCDRCGIGYAPAAIARAPVLTMRAGCPRCSGRLRQADGDRANASGVVAVRSLLNGDRAATEGFDGARARTSVVVYERVLPALPLSVRRIRKECDSVLKVLGVDVRRRQDIALAVSEAATNVVLHAYLGVALGPIDVDAVVRGRDVVIAVVDDGSGMRPRKDSPGLGAGLSVIKQVCDELQVLSGVGGRGTHVRMTFGDVAPAVTAPTRSEAVQSTVRARDEAGTLRDYADALLAGSSALHDESSAVVAQARRAVAYSAERRDARRSRAARAAHDGQADGQPLVRG